MKNLVRKILKNICITYLVVSLFMTIAVMFEIEKEKKSEQNNTLTEQMPVIEVIDSLQLTNTDNSNAYFEALSRIAFIVFGTQFIILIVASSIGTTFTIVDAAQNKKLAKELNSQLKKRK